LNSTMDVVNTIFTIVACFVDFVCLGAVFYIDERYKARFEDWERNLHKVREDLDIMAANTAKVVQNTDKVCADIKVYHETSKKAAEEPKAEAEESWLALPKKWFGGRKPAPAAVRQPAQQVNVNLMQPVQQTPQPANAQAGSAADEKPAQQ